MGGICCGSTALAYIYGFSASFDIAMALVLGVSWVMAFRACCRLVRFYAFHNFLWAGDGPDGNSILPLACV